MAAILIIFRTSVINEQIKRTSHKSVVISQYDKFRWSTYAYNNYYFKQRSNAIQCYRNVFRNEQPFLHNDARIPPKQKWKKMNIIGLQARLQAITIKVVKHLVLSVLCCVRCFWCYTLSGKTLLLNYLLVVCLTMYMSDLWLYMRMKTMMCASAFCATDKIRIDWHRCMVS